MENEKKYNGDPYETEEELLFAWESDGRLYKQRGKDFYSSMVVLALLVSVIMFFIEGLMPVFLIWSVVFVIWALTKTPPVAVAHKITSWGIRSEDQLYVWGEMNNFWFEEKWGKKILRVLLRRRFPGQLILIVNEKDQEKIKEMVNKFVVLEKPKPSWSDKLVKWFGEKVPLDEKP